MAVIVRDEKSHHPSLPPLLPFGALKISPWVGLEPGLACRWSVVTITGSLWTDAILTVTNVVFCLRAVVACPVMMAGQESRAALFVDLSRKTKLSVPNLVCGETLGQTDKQQNRSTDR
ncbi:hypothetical protein RRG08_065141 [Elysia crispata]|uniref:Uncharacterized protein n=1 Tax=Elysia crispata TaxID=231223 RepID=A0AAE0ZA23_9GAST|nr:hypothetical protein RRG08_065141 [Elysia crispata]